jgi:hypothetical protein
LNKRKEREVALAPVVAVKGPPPAKAHRKPKLPTSKVPKSFPVASPVASPPPTKKHKKGTTVKTPSPSSAAKEIRTVTPVANTQGPGVTEDHSSVTCSILAHDDSSDTEQEVDDEVAQDLFTQVQDQVTLEQLLDTLDIEGNMPPTIKELQAEVKKLSDELFDVNRSLGIRDGELASAQWKLSVMTSKGDGIDPKAVDHLKDEIEDLKEKNRAEVGLADWLRKQVEKHKDLLNEEVKKHQEVLQELAKKHQAEIATLKDGAAQADFPFDPDQLVESQKKVVVSEKKVAKLKIDLCNTATTAGTLQKQLNEARAEKLAGMTVGKVQDLKAELKAAKALAQTLQKELNETRAEKIGEMTVEEVQDLKKELDCVKSANKAAQRVFETAKKTIKDLKDQLAKASQQEGEVEEVDRDKLDWDKPIKDWTKGELITGMLVKEDDYDELEAKYNETAEYARGLQAALKSTGKASKAEMRPFITKAAREALKEVVFRKTKLLSSRKTDEVRRMTDEVYDLIKEACAFNKTFTKEEFYRIYHKNLMQYFSDIRSQTQTAVAKACFGE